ncbi:MAG: metallophosphoesterase family protein [Thermoplasmata archaeon]|nr:metallophosphoesterase family protein [Thermoplasmata archaeon]
MRILIISDIHGNADALRTVLNREKYDAIWFLGDLTDYGPEPHIVLDILRELKPEIWIMGNHDYANAFGVDCGCGERTHDVSVYTRENITQRFLTQEDLKFLKSLPLKKELHIDYREFYFVHGCPADPLYGYMFDFMPECMRNEIGGIIHADYLLFGHTHYPLIGQYESLMYLNPGSVGQPRDGDPRASYAIYENGKLELKRVPYPVENTIRKLREVVKDRNYREKLIYILRNGKV